MDEPMTPVSRARPMMVAVSSIIGFVWLGAWVEVFALVYVAETVPYGCGL